MVAKATEYGCEEKKNMTKLLKFLFLNRYHMRFLAVSLADVIIVCIGCYQLAIGSDNRIVCLAVAGILVLVNYLVMYHGLFSVKIKGVGFDLVPYENDEIPLKKYLFECLQSRTRANACFNFICRAKALGYDGVWEKMSQLEAEKCLCVLIIASKTRFGIVNAVYDHGAWDVLNDDLPDDMQKFEPLLYYCANLVDSADITVEKFADIVEKRKEELKV